MSMGDEDEILANTTKMRVEGRSGATVREGVEKNTPKVTLLEKGTIVQVEVETEVKNSNDDVRVKIVSPVVGYVTKRFLGRVQ